MSPGPLHPVGFWSEGGGPVLKLTAISVVDSDTPNSQAGCRLNNDGTLEAYDSAGYYSLHAPNEWVDAASQGAGFGDDYEMKFVKSSGDNLSGGLTNDTWYALTVARQGYLTTSFGTKTYNGTLYVREIADTSNQVSCSVYFSATRI